MLFIWTETEMIMNKQHHDISVLISYWPQHLTPLPFTINAL